MPARERTTARARAAAPSAMVTEMIPNKWDLPDLGLGLGLRTVHYDHILGSWPEVDWFEIISENFMRTAGRPLWVLDQIAERYPMVMHGVSLSIGSTDPIDFEYLRLLKALAERIDVAWLGDHICWTGVAGRNGHDLRLIPYNEETLSHVVDRVRVVQDYLERPLVLENASTYLTFAASNMPEEVWIREMAEQADCALLLDVNNVYVNCRNHDLDPWEYLGQYPYQRVVQIHLAGHTDKGTHCIDTHNDHVIDEVWDYYGFVHQRSGGRSTLLEWDDDIPEFGLVHDEVLKAPAFRRTAESPNVR